jgi:hypothetical protein
MANSVLGSFQRFQRFLHDTNPENVPVGVWEEYHEDKKNLPQRSYHLDSVPDTQDGTLTESSPTSSPAELYPDLSVMTDDNGHEWYAVSESDVDELCDPCVPRRCSTVQRITIQDVNGKWWRRNA